MCHYLQRPHNYFSGDKKVFYSYQHRRKERRVFVSQIWIDGIFLTSAKDEVTNHFESKL